MAREIEWIEANAFDLLRDYADAGRQYDTHGSGSSGVCQDQAQTLETALRGYKELNLRALKMLRPGGILVTCSCSYHVSAADFLETVTAAARGCAQKSSVAGEPGGGERPSDAAEVPETAT